MTPYSCASSQPSRSLRLAALLILLSVVLCPMAGNAAEVFSLTNAQRKDYLRYYAPVIFKSANEGSKIGRDWITNYDFERDKTFSSNRSNWEQKLAAYVGGDTDLSSWRIRPTLYAALIEFQENASKSVVLLYHVYHAMEPDSVHDWERVEIRIDNVSGTPGSASETILYVLATQHSTHVPRTGGDVQFMEVPGGGRHPMILQGHWADSGALRKNELRHVVTPWKTISDALANCTANACATATVDATNLLNTEPTTSQRVNYVFVPQGDAAAVKYWNALKVAPGADGKLIDKAAGTSAAVAWKNVKRLTYELQDLADILPTHASAVSTSCSVKSEHGWGVPSAHWWVSSKVDDSYLIHMTDAVYNEAGSSGTALVPTSASCGGQQVRFYCYSKDGSSKDDAQGYPCKHWFWGAYITGIDKGSYTDEAFDGDPFYDSSTTPMNQGKRRYCRDANGNVNPWWCQHDYFAHKGKKGSAANQDKLVEEGKWLEPDWHTATNGGFDGRWVQLFADRY